MVVFFGGGVNNHVWMKRDFFLGFGSSLLSVTDFSPFLFLFNLPSTFLAFPVGSAIVPEMKKQSKVELITRRNL